MALRSYQNYFNDGGLVNHNALNRLYNAQSVADRYSDTVETSYLNDAFNTRLTPQEEAVKQQWLATVGKDFNYPGNTYDYDLNTFIRHNVVPNGAKPDERNHLDDSGKKWMHPTPSNGALISDERMLGLARPTGEVGQWINFDLNSPDGRNYYKSLSPEGQRLVRQMARDGAVGGYITGRANMYGNKALQRYFDKREEGNILLDPRRPEYSSSIEYPSNYELINKQHTGLERT